MNSPLHTVDRLILGLGHFLADFVAPASTPRTEGAIGAAPFAVSPEGIAGRTRLGPDLAVLYRPGVVASVAVFSWGALSLLLGNVGERWAMIPTRDAELVRLEVRQQLESARLAEPRARWFAMVLGGAIVTLILSLGAGRLLGSGAAASFVLLLFGGATWLAANLLLLGSVRRIGDRLYRTSVTLEYGYPEKTRLLVALSDAPIAEQRQAATRLLQTFAERGASQWDYLDAQGGRGLGLSFGGGGSQLSALLRRLVRPAIGLAIVWALFSYAVPDVVGAVDAAREAEREAAEAAEAAVREARTHPSTMPARFRGRFTRTVAGGSGEERLDIGAATLVFSNRYGDIYTGRAEHFEVVSDTVVSFQMTVGGQCSSARMTVESLDAGALVVQGCLVSGAWDLVAPATIVSTPPEDGLGDL
jgi:hypothetical protein